MRRTGFILVALGVGALLWLLVGGAPQELNDIDPVDQPASNDDNGAATLQGNATAEASAEDTGGEGAYRIRGIVLNQSNEPVAGVPLEVRRSASTWPSGGYRVIQKHNTRSVRVRAKALVAGVHRHEVSVALITSGQDGRFEVLVERAQPHVVYALPPAPVAGGYASAFLHPQGRTTIDVKVYVFAGVPLRGTVVDAAGKPVSASVAASHRAASRKTGQWRGVASTDASNGGFVFDVAPHGDISFEVALASGRRYTGFEAEPPFDDVVLRLPAGVGAIRGRARTSDDEPVADALVSLTLQIKGDSEPAARIELGATSDAQGQFAFADLPLGDIVQVGATAPTFLATQRYKGRDGFVAIPINPNGPTDVAVTMQRGSTVEGQVTRKDDDSVAISDATVTLYFLGRHPPETETTKTDTSGRYRFSGLGTGKFLLIASHPKHFSPDVEAALQQQSWSGGKPPPHLVAELGAEDRVIERDLALSLGFALRGLVLDPEGQPAAKAGLFIKDFGLPSAGQRWGMMMSSAQDPVAVTDAKGQFAISGMAPRPDWVLFARKPGYAGEYSDNVTLIDRDVGDVVVRLERQCIVRGRVLGDEQTPLAEQSIFAGANLNGAGFYYKSDKRGRFELHSLSATDQTISTRHAGHTVQVKLTGLAPGDVREGVDLVFGNKVEIVGHVKTSDGAGVPGVTVIASRLDGKQEHRQAHSTQTGQFRIKDVSPGPVQLRIREGRGNPRIAGEPIKAPASEVLITYDPPTKVTIKGTVVGPNGKPVPFADVIVSADSGTKTSNGPVRDGVFEVRATGDAPYYVYVHKAREAGGALLNLQSGSVEIHDPRHSAAIHLEAGGSVAGRALDAEGNGVVGVEIKAERGTARSDARGRWRIVGIAPGRVGLSFKPPRIYVPVPPLVADTGDEDIVVHLTKGASITGRVVLPEGTRIRGGSIVASWPQGATRGGQVRGTVQPNLSFVVSGVPLDGVVALVFTPFQDRNGASQIASARIEGIHAGATDVEITPVVGVSISGIVVRADGSPLVGAGVSISGNGQGWGRTDAKGRFDVSGLRRGAFKLVVGYQDTVGIRERVTAPSSDLRFEWPDLGSIAGRLDDVPKGEPWTVGAADAVTGDPGPGAAILVKADGTWEIGSLARGRTWTISARHQNASSDRFAQSAVVATGAKDVTLAWKTGQSIQGRVRSTNSLPSMTFVSATKPGWTSGTRCDAKGGFTLRALPPGTYALRCFDMSTGQAGTLDAVAAGTTDVEVVMAPKK